MIIGEAHGGITETAHRGRDSSSSSIRAECIGGCGLEREIERGGVTRGPASEYHHGQ